MAVHAESSIQLNTIPAYTSLLGGHFVYKSTTSPSGLTVPSANIIENLNDNPIQWGYNTHIGSNGIKLRYNETTLSEWINNCLTFYKPGTTNPSLQITGGNNAALNIYNPKNNVKTLGLDANGLSFYGTSTSAPDVTLNADGLTLINGSIRGGVVGQDEFLYLSPQVFSDEYEEYVLSTDTVVDETKTYYIRSGEEGEYVYTEVSEPTGSPQENGYYEIAHAPGTIPIDNYIKNNWRQIIGRNFAVDTDGNLYANNADISGKIIATEGQIGGWNIGTDTNKSLFYGNQVPGATTNNLVMSSNSVENTTPIAGSDIDKHWFLSAGTKFGVDTEGNLYATGAKISGKVEITNGSNVYTKDEVDFVNNQIDTIVGAAAWIGEYGTYKLTTDTTIVPEKLYFTLTGTAVENPVGNPSQLKYYEQTANEMFVLSTDTSVDSQKTYYTVIGTPTVPTIEDLQDLYELNTIDSTVSNFLTSHVIIDESGLKVTFDEARNSYLLLTGDSVTIYRNGNPVSTYGETTILGNEEGCHLEISGGAVPELGFYSGQGSEYKVAYINHNQLYIPQVVVVTSMQVGDERIVGAWRWLLKESGTGAGTMGLYWIAGTGGSNNG